MLLSVADQLAIQQVIALHGHLSDAGAFDRFGEVFSADVVYDLREYGAGLVHGIDDLREMALQLGDRNPLGHHVTNIVIVDGETDSATTVSKGFAVQTDGSTASAVYADVLRRTDDGWRIVHRRITPRRKPLTP